MRPSKDFAEQCEHPGCDLFYISPELPFCEPHRKKNALAYRAEVSSILCDRASDYAESYAHHEDGPFLENARDALENAAIAFAIEVLAEDQRQRRDD